MKALVVRAFGAPDALEIIDVAVPEPGPGQVRVRVAGSSVNPIDLSTRSGALADAGLLVAASETALGCDVAGTVDGVGAGVTMPRAACVVASSSSRSGVRQRS
jgi:NADPH2:quinone reductase